MDILAVISEELQLRPVQVNSTVELIIEGGTVPFIARYRKERTGNLDEEKIRDIQHKYEYYKELDERRAAIIDSIREQGKLTPELEAKIAATRSKTELEDLYLPYKPKRTTRGLKAKEAGLEPLARWLAGLTDAAADLAQKAAEFLNPEKNVDTAEKALAGACDILAEELSEDADVRKRLREEALGTGMIKCAVKKEFEGVKTKFEMYYDFNEPVKTLPSHRILAMLRGEREKVLRLWLEMDAEAALAFLESRLIVHRESAAVSLLKSTVRDSFERLLLPATETEVRMALKDRAEEEAFAVFGDNLRALLLAPPAGQKAVLGVDPGFRTGCKVVALDNTGKFLEYQTIFPHEPHNRSDEAAMVVLAMIKRHGISLVAIGNGTAGRESESFIRKTIEIIPADQRPVCVVVSEAGASVYSASDLARAEFPDQDVTVRGAVSIGRRLQDPLAELVKIDPKAIGVGQYQHDVTQSKLKDRLEEVVESSVNRVGVNVNLASEELLKYVAGLNRTVAKKIVEFRNANGAFGSREDLKKVSGLGAKTFEQAAGFLRIPGAANPLDNSAVHPERYAMVTTMAASMDTTVQSLIGNSTLIRRIDKSKFIAEDAGELTVNDILAELEKPGRDPRAEFRYASFNDAVKEISDLKEGMALEGVVTNVTNFGAFVDIGVHQDGLVHISQLSDRFVQDPLQVVSVGDVVRVRVVSVDTQLKRIGLTMKSDTPAPQVRQPQQQRQPQKQTERKPAPPRPAPRPAATANDLKQRFDGSGKGEKKLFTVKPKFNVKQFMK